MKKFFSAILAVLLFTTILPSAVFADAEANNHDAIIKEACILFPEYAEKITNAPAEQGIALHVEPMILQTITKEYDGGEMTLSEYSNGVVLLANSIDFNVSSTISDYEAVDVGLTRYKRNLYVTSNISDEVLSVIGLCYDFTSTYAHINSVGDYYMKYNTNIFVDCNYDSTSIQCAYVKYSGDFKWDGHLPLDFTLKVSIAPQGRCWTSTTY